MTKNTTNTVHIEDFLRVRESDAGSGLVLDVLNRPDAGRYLHDLFAATQSFKMLIELNRNALVQPSERDVKKFSQLSMHAARLEELAHFVTKLLERNDA